MCRKWVVGMTALLIAANCQAGLQQKLGELLGLEQPQTESVGFKGVGASEPASTTDLTVWFMGTSDLDSPDNEFIARLGVQLEDVEVGAQSHWLGVHGDNQSYGVYALLHLEGDFTSWVGRPYVGYAASLGVDSEDGSSYGPVLGTVYSKIFVIEYQYRDFSGKLGEQLGDENDVHKVFVGARIGY